MPVLGFPEKISRATDFQVFHGNSETASQIASVFGLEKRDATASSFAGNIVEVMNTMYLGKNGHIAIGCNDVDRACAYLANKGITFWKKLAK
jgi:2-dehydro-3-deoxyphosphogluconate aldolase/(4S)-4-hydroxy-2-oxoglutarate aldolase